MTFRAVRYKMERMNRAQIAIYTLGCKVNQQESASLARELGRMGFALVPPGSPADAYVINSCTVTRAADSRTRQRIRQARAHAPGAIIAVIGCYPQVAAEELARMDEVDLVVTSEEKERTAEILAAALTKRGRGADLVRSGEAIPGALGGRTRAYVKIEDGCDRNCAYCVIPLARGRVRSRLPEEVIRDVELLLENGYKELVVTGINMALYGRDLGMKDGLYSLLERLCAIGGRADESGFREYRLRLGSLEPTVIDAEAVSRIACLPRICPQFHLSLQSGCGRILRAMGRPYAPQDYHAILRALRGTDPRFAVTTDVIVGFPGETEEDFEESHAFVEQAEFARVHVFRYSRRPGTAAASMPDQVPAASAAERCRRMTATAKRSMSGYLEGCIGQVRRTLLFGPDKSGRGILGVTDTGIDVCVPLAMLPMPGAGAANAFVDLMLERNIFAASSGFPASSE
ncbi:MAG: tRNA (N(6)-L-threonylcarbamoyladenosine(37)-C(2))-methylthiotransferase MtaB [Clostridiales Family XIII bacterium]|nr:tRNA (N(6)-L-threonylcarbamoyladenosine(37)-C(2))-methylthiotransferase MtaB [Clostridiales Family XIII bacterium]